MSQYMHAGDTDNMNILWDRLHNEFGVSTETLSVVTTLNGWTRETMEDILYVVSGLRSFDQADDDEA